MSLFQSLHVDVELVSLIFCLQKVNLVGILIPDAEILTFLRAIRHRHPFVVGDELDFHRLSSANDGIIDRNRDVTWRSTFVIAEVHVIQRPKHTHLPSLSLPGIDDVSHAFHVKLLDLKVSQEVEGLVPSDDIKIVNLYYLNNVEIGLFIDLLLELPHESPFF